MASLVLTIDPGVGPTYTNTKAPSDALVNRLIAAYQIAANAKMNRTATRKEVLDYWWVDVVLAGARAQIESYDRQVQLDAVPPVPSAAFNGG